MNRVVLQTARLQLVLQTPEEVLGWVDSLPSADRAEVSPVWLARVRETQPGDPWSLSYSMILTETGLSIGGCAFKGPPDSTGMVEVAYGVDEAYRGRGYATEATAALVKFAETNPQVQRVQAHTRIGDPISARVLEKCGFRTVGEVIDPEDGPVLRWERQPPTDAD